VSRRFVFDITTLVRWAGEPTGTQRVESELARFARENIPGVEFVFFDPGLNAFRIVEQPWLDMMLSGKLSVADAPTPVPPGHHPRRRHSLAARLRRTVHDGAVLRLEWTRLTARNAIVVTAAGWLRDGLVPRRLASRMFDGEGRRRACVAFRAVVGPEVDLDRDTVLVSVGFAWDYLDFGVVKRILDQSGASFVHFCHDMIPVQFPEFFTAEAAAHFDAQHRIIFPLCELVVVSTRTVERDVKEFCRRRGIALPKIAALPFGADALRDAPALPLSEVPAHLEEARYALFVGTIEPRKGHALLHRVWLRLLAEGIPRAARFKLVFVGRIGWCTEEFRQALAGDERIKGTLEVLPTVTDGMLKALYENAAFCVYPSTYEGFGLPLAEGLSFGKAVIASTGGAVPEVVGPFAPHLDPADEEAWYAMIKSWILDPTAREPYESAIRREYRPATWRGFSARFFEAAASVGNVRTEKSRAAVGG
jgi:glycosyltransferase involved in cell wall biosynthesis